MIDLFINKYEGEMLFNIEDVSHTSDLYTFIIKANYNGNTVGAKVELPVIIRKSLFKTIKLIKNNSQIRFTSIGEESDALICALEDLLKPPYKSTKRFSEEPEGIDFTVLNREMYELDNDKIYIRLYNGEDQSDFEEDEKINLEMQFSFNFASKRASLSEVRDGFSADIIAILMK